MVTPPFGAELMTDDDAQAKKIRPEFVKRRGPHLSKLGPLEEMVRRLAPLPPSYDVNRLGPEFFGEFTYTELLGCLYVQPQSCECAARMVQMAYDRDEQGFDVATAVLARKGTDGTLDKYVLDPAKGAAKAVAFLPGENMVADAVSKEVLNRAMHQDADLVLKPHPMTDPPLVKKLAQEFGYYRVIDPLESGDAYLHAAERVYCAPTNELGLYAILLGKPVWNIGSFFHEAVAAYTPFYRLLWGREPGEAKDILTHLLNSPFSGVFHPDDPEVEQRMATFFEAAMQVREVFRPLVREFPRNQPPTN